MENWKKYQEEVAQLFKELGCIVEIEASVQGVRARHDIDVWVRFARFGIQQARAIECKLWQRPIPKEKILALKSVVEDVGADRGILIAESGCQPGAHAAVSSTNISLMSLNELRESAKPELLSLALIALHKRAVLVKELSFSLYDHEHWSDGKFHGGGSSRPKPGVDGKAVMNAVSNASVILMGVERVQLGDFPVPIQFDNTGDKVVRSPNRESFVTRAERILDDLEKVLKSQKVQKQ